MADPLGPDDPQGAGDEVDASRAPLMDHLVELRRRLIIAFAALGVGFFLCFFVAETIFNILLAPYERAAGESHDLQLIYTAPLEYFFTQVRLAAFGGFFLAFPVIAAQLYLFVAPGLYKNEKRAFLPFLAATPILFTAGAALVYFVVMPLAMRFALSFEQMGADGEVSIQLLARVSEYLSLITTLIIAFGLSFQLPVILTLLARVGILGADSLVKNRKYAIVGVFAFAAFMTPPDPISQLGLAAPILLLYEISVWLVRAMERRAAAADDQPIASG
ncbi:MAG: twin-arginine translocase subunit TatC [Pseudomonadota bacterium]